MVLRIGNRNEDPLAHLASPVSRCGRVRMALFPAVRTYLPRKTCERMVGAILPDDWTLDLKWNLAGADE